jgi:hypothetical protein
MAKKPEKATENNELMTIENIGKQIDEIVDLLPKRGMAANVTESLKIASGISQLKRVFNQPQCKAIVLEMKDTALGFLTDRSEDALNRAKREQKVLVAYSYNQIASACIEAMIQGYRITNNEFNIIAGRFYAAKNGKFRLITDNPDISNFEFTTTSPLYESEQRMSTKGKPYSDNYAKVQCFARWKHKGHDVKMGYDEKDKLIFKVKVNYGMGDDAIIGKALSKLFSRALMRIEGNIIPESEDLDPMEVDLIEHEEASSSSSSLAPAQSLSSDIQELEALVVTTIDRGLTATNKPLAGFEKPASEGSLTQWMIDFLKEAEGVYETTSLEILKMATESEDNFSDFCEQFGLWFTAQPEAEGKGKDEEQKTSQKPDDKPENRDKKAAPAETEEKTKSVAEIEQEGREATELIDRLMELKMNHPREFLQTVKGGNIDHVDNQKRREWLQAIETRLQDPKF